MNIWTYTNNTETKLWREIQYESMRYIGDATYGFKIIFKCMTGSTIKSGKFILPISKKMTYSKATERCERLGLQVSLPVSSEEQAFINSLSDFTSNWLRIELTKKILLG